MKSLYPETNACSNSTTDMPAEDVGAIQSATGRVRALTAQAREFALLEARIFGRDLPPSASAESKPMGALGDLSAALDELDVVLAQANRLLKLA